MAEEKYANAKCFILSPSGYEEISYSELCRRKDTDESYKSKKFIPLHGMLMEVIPEQYIDFYKTRRRQKYLDERSAANGDISIDMLTTPELYGENILTSSEDIAEQLVHKMMLDKLRNSLGLLTADEMALIEALFYNGLTEREYAIRKGVYHNAIHKKKLRILRKLKTFLEN